MAALLCGRRHEQPCPGETLQSMNIQTTNDKTGRCRITAVMMGLAFSITVAFIFQSSRADVPLAVASGKWHQTAEGHPTLAPVLEKVIPAVVHIETKATVMIQRRSPFDDPFFRRFFNMPPQNPQPRKQGGAGSGVIVDSDKGYIITNSHVVRKADDIVVTLDDGRRYEARVTGTDPGADIAILQIDADNLQQAKIGDSEKLKVGDFVLAIGNPFGLEQSVTLGIVSALGRNGLGIESYEDFIQTDASINPGNSGGALINLGGEVIGINTAILGGSGGNIGIGFAIPINMVMDITQQLLKYGEVKRGRLGVLVQSLTPDLAKAFGTDRNHGVVIAQVEENSAAEKAGLLSGDIVLSINGREVENASDMRNSIGLMRSGSEVNLSILRDDEIMEITATITMKSNTVIEGGTLSKKLDGTVLTISRGGDKSEKASIKVKEIEEGSLPYRQGLRQDDVIVSINKKPTSDFESAKRAINDDDDPILLHILREGRRLFVAIR